MPFCRFQGIVLFRLFLERNNVKREYRYNLLRTLWDSAPRQGMSWLWYSRKLLCTLGEWGRMTSRFCCSTPQCRSAAVLWQSNLKSKQGQIRHLYRKQTRPMCNCWQKLIDHVIFFFICFPNQTVKKTIFIFGRSSIFKVKLIRWCNWSFGDDV